MYNSGTCWIAEPIKLVISYNAHTLAAKIAAAPRPTAPAAKAACCAFANAFDINVSPMSIVFQAVPNALPVFVLAKLLPNCLSVGKSGLEPTGTLVALWGGP